MPGLSAFALRVCFQDGQAVGTAFLPSVDLVYFQAQL